MRAQVPIIQPTVPKDTSHVINFHKQVDVIDLIKRTGLFHVNPKPDTTLKKGKIYLALIPSPGYTLESQWIGILSLNASFYTADPRTTNLSTITGNLEYSIKNQVTIPVISTIWLDKNKINILTDYRYYVYPSTTYGLGGQTTINNADNVDYGFLQLSQEALFRIVPGLYGGAGYILDYHHNIKDYGDASNFAAYNGTTTRTTSSGPLVHIKYDTRDNINNPKDALFASITYRNNLTVLGSNNNWQSIAAEYRQYIRLTKHTKNVLALWSWNTFTFGHAPYFDLPSTAWDNYNNTGRGYIQSRYRGANMMYLEAEYRFGITHNGLLGGVVFMNAETVSDYPGNRFTTIAPGEGVGLRIKINKHSGTNFCIDYGFGNEGSHGFFFNLGEIF